VLLKEGKEQEEGGGDLFSLLVEIGKILRLYVCFFLNNIIFFNMRKKI
jgi:hypothetical protein